MYLTVNYKGIGWLHYSPRGVVAQSALDYSILGRAGRYTTDKAAKAALTRYARTHATH